MSLVLLSKWRWRLHSVSCLGPKLWSYPWLLCLSHPVWDLSANHVGAIFNIRIQPLVTTPQLPSWCKPPSSLAWILGVASPCFLSGSPAVPRLSSFQNPPERSLTSRVNAKVFTVTYKTLHSLDPFLVTWSPFPFLWLCPGHFPSCMPVAYLMVSMHCHQLAMSYIALVIYNLAGKCDSFCFFSLDMTEWNIVSFILPGGRKESWVCARSEQRQREMNLVCPWDWGNHLSIIRLQVN